MSHSMEVDSFPTSFQSWHVVVYIEISMLFYVQAVKSSFAFLTNGITVY